MNYFKVPYFLFPFAYHSKLKNKIIEGIDKQESYSHDNIDDTDWTVDSSPYFDIFKNEFIQEVDKKFSKFSIGPWTVGKVWYQRYSTGNNHLWHKHGKCHWTCVYYVQLPEDAPGTHIKDPYTNQIVTLPVREGDIFIIPSQLWHCSPVNQSNKNKLIISLNIDSND